MDNPGIITAGSQKKLWEQFESSIQEFRSNKTIRDAEFQAGLDRLKSKLDELNMSSE